MCRIQYGYYWNITLWLLAEVSIAACDVAEVIGSAVALQLLFNIPLFFGVLLTAADVLVILFIEQVPKTLLLWPPSFALHEVLLQGLRAGHWLQWVDLHKGGAGCERRVPNLQFTVP